MLYDIIDEIKLLLTVVIELLMMKNRSMHEQDFITKPMFQSGYTAPYIPQRQITVPRQYSVDKNIRRISPVPQERFSLIPTTVVYPVQTYSNNNDYQMPRRITEINMPNDSSKINFDSSRVSDSSKLIQDLMQRIQKLQTKCQKLEKFEFKIQKLESSHPKLEERIIKLQIKKQQQGKGKQNAYALDNRLNDQEIKNRIRQQYISRDQLQKNLTILDSAFKTHLSTFKTVLNAEMGEHNTKNKKKFIEITATQLNQKLQQFRSKIAKEWEVQIKNVVRQSILAELVERTVIGLSRQKFIGSAIPLTVREELSVTVESNRKQISIIQTTYYVDKNGFLLDKNMYYLLDKNNKEIKLAEDKIQLLKRQGLMMSLPSSKQLIGIDKKLSPKNLL